MDYSNDYRGPVRYSMPDNSKIDLEKYIEPFGWCPFTTDPQLSNADELLVAFMADNTILPYQP